LRALRCMPALFQRVLFRVASITRIVAACSGSACWPLPLGSLRHSRDAALLPVGWCDCHPRECVFGSNRCWRRDGKRLPDIRHALPACRRQVTDGCRCTRDRALVDGFVCCTRVVWNGECVRVFCPAIWLCFGLAQVLVDCRQPRDECIMVRVLVERGPHDVPPGAVACGSAAGQFAAAENNTVCCCSAASRQWSADRFTLHSRRRPGAHCSTRTSDSMCPLDPVDDSVSRSGAILSQCWRDAPAHEVAHHAGC
jgi:hypothetical protein